MTNKNGSARPSCQRRLLRIAVRTLGIGCGVCIVWAAAVLFVNRHDDPLSPGAGAWLTPPVASTPDAANAWLGMLGVGYEQPPGIEAGRRYLDLFRHNPPAFDDEPDTSSLGKTWRTENIDSSLCSIKLKGPGILARLLASPETGRRLVTSHQTALARYYAAIALPDFQESPLPALVTHQQFVATAKAACLARMDLSLRLTAGDANTVSLIVQHTRYWQQATSHAQSALSALLADAQVRADLDWLADLRKTNPTLGGQAFAILRPALQAFATTPREKYLASALRGELRYLQWSQSPENLLKQQETFAHPPSWPERYAYHHLYQPQATLNATQHYFSELLSRDSIRCEAFPALRPFNPVGMKDLCASMPHYVDYLIRLRETREAASKLANGTP